MAYTVPIYSGCKNIQEYFPEKSYIPINLEDSQKSILEIQRIIVNSDEIYSNYLDQLTLSRTKILFEYNLIQLLINFFENEIQHYSEYQTSSLRPSESFNDHHSKMYVLRAKRFINKYLN